MAVLPFYSRLCPQSVPLFHIRGLGFTAGVSSASFLYLVVLGSNPPVFMTSGLATLGLGFQTVFDRLPVLA
jgi:hypothetical protein